MSLKLLLILIDGIGDTPCNDYSQTPLEAAKTSNMDHLASQGKIGLIGIDPDGQTPISSSVKENWATIVDMPIEEDTPKLAGMDVTQMPSLKITPDDYKLRYEKVLMSASKHEAILVRMNAPDNFGLNGDFEGKKKSIEDIDKYFFGPLIKALPIDSVTYAITASHATPCHLKKHTRSPLPLLIAGPDTARNDPGEDGKSNSHSQSPASQPHVSGPAIHMKFSEQGCKNGTLGVMKTADFMALIMRMSDMQ